MPHMIRGAKRVSRCEECQHIHERQLRKLHTLTTQQSRTVNKVQKSRSWSVLDRAEKRRAVHRKGANFENLELFLNVLKTRYGNTPVYCDEEECLRKLVHSTAGRHGLPTGVTAVEQSQANGRAEQRVRALRERLQIMVEDARRSGVEIILDHPVTQWAVRHAEWIENFLVKGGLKKHTPETKHRAMLLDFWNEFLFVAKSTMANSPDFWSVGHLVKKTPTPSLPG